MGYWNTGILESRQTHHSIMPTFQHSNTPILQYSHVRWLARFVLIVALAFPGCATLQQPEKTEIEQEPPTHAETVLRARTPPDAEDALEKAVRQLARYPDNLAESFEPSNDRQWSPDMARLAGAEFHGNSVTVRNIRNCDYRTADDYTVGYYDKAFDLNKLESVDFIVVPFLASPGLAHVMMSFGFEDDQYLGLSVEIRREEGEKYVPLNGVLRQYELIYVIGDERDLIKQCTDVHLNAVYLYRGRFKPEEVRALFVDVMQRANQLAWQPEFYNTFTNNCTTNIVRHVNRLGTQQIPYGYRVIFPGHFDGLLYELGLVETDAPSFEQARLRSRVNQLAYLNGDNPNFSAKIRR